MSKEKSIEENKNIEDVTPNAENIGSTTSQEVRGETSNVNEETKKQTAESITTNDKKLRTYNLPLTTQNMEVHHHPHIEKKNFKEYFLEFVMIFLAVTMGFIAENLREHLAESNREEAFAQELYTELKDDSIAVANKVLLRLEKEKEMEQLSAYFKDSSLASLPKFFYPAFTKDLYLFNTYTYEPKDGILTQLRTSGAILGFKNIQLQKFLGDISVSINNIRNRNEQEYQFFANPVKPFLLEHYDWSWYNDLRKRDTDTSSLNVINRYLQSSDIYAGKILNIETINRTEAANMILFYKQMLLSTRTFNYNNYINLNHAILVLLRKNYKLNDE